MTPQMNANVTEAPAGIVLTYSAAPPLQPIKPPVWLWTLAVTAGLGLLVGFYFAVRAIEQQGERRRLEVATHEEATWRCQALVGRLPRANCLAQLNAPGDKGLMVQAVARTDQR